jgi:hypothetical protein
MRSRTLRRARSDSTSGRQAPSPSDNARLEINPVPLTNDPEHRPGVLTDVGPPAGDLFAAGEPPVVYGGDVAAVDRDWLAFDLPAEPGALDRLGDRLGGVARGRRRVRARGVLRTENIESLLVIPAGMTHFL